MYSLDCEYYVREFETLDELINDIVKTGMDPNYQITRDGLGIGESGIDLIII